ncbi:glutathione S-transferase family protein [Novosphingobium beihaiensis]|uniref:Glutathione S-transferase family protein n=1 Tax=Novosphingobium beihaiensis TaxID=2930389 RepID=A0ABT0BLZ3_9SPHN|nr:glutathione S-transferase family protein [Novosphingobium beihaiensis]MCJ2186057.1 glutathione S-transferase family protein [Novosphingobium beihaiensis]
MITLYHAPHSRSTRMIWLLEELAVPYEIRPVSIFRPMTGEGAPDPANPHPDKRVPAIVHGETLVAESVAIVLYLADTFPKAGLAPIPGDARRGDYLTWLAWYATELEPAMFAGLAGELAASPQKQRSHDIVMQRLESALSRSPCLMGDVFTAADFLVSSALVFGRAAFPESAAIDAYIERCHARPAAQRTQALDNASGPQELALASI